jgi:CheY-like chemotaxis protein
MKRVLLLDPDEAFLTAATEHLSASRLGLAIETCRDRSESLERIRVAPPDVFVVGLETGSLTDLEFLIEARNATRSLPVIALVARMSASFRNDLIELPHVELFGKPVHLRALEGAIQRAIAGKPFFEGTDPLETPSEDQPLTPFEDAADTRRIELDAWKRGGVSTAVGETAPRRVIEAPFDDPYETAPFGDSFAHAADDQPVAPPRPTVAALSLPEALLVELGVAIAPLPVSLIAWRSPEEAVPGDGVLLAELPAGARRIPDQVVEVLSRMGPSASLVLVAKEPLREPAATLEGGRVTLIAPPASGARLVQAARLLLAERLPVEGAFQRVTPRFYAATLDRGAATPPALDVASGLLALVPFDPGPVVSVASLALFLRPDEIDGGALSAKVGPSGLIALRSDGTEWVLFWPRPTGALWLYSASRVPRVFDVAAALSRSGRTLFCLPARSGDCVVGLTALFPEVQAKLLETSASGGPATLGALSQLPGRFSAVVAEMR